MRSSRWGSFFVWRAMPTLLLVLIAAPASAVIVRGNRELHQAAPADDPGWSNVGIRGGASAVYLGERWVLTAAHVGGGEVSFDGVPYDWIPETLHRLHDPSDANGPTDLVLFQIAEVPPGLENLTLGNVAPSRGAVVLGIGHSRNRDDGRSTWWVNTRKTPPAWSPTKIKKLPAYRGFQYADGWSKGWGRSQIALGSSPTNYGMGSVYTFLMDFSETGGCGDDEMMVTPGDSGGALFIQRAGQWELIGILVSRRTYPGQPSDAAVFGNSILAADLTRYRDQIVGIMTASTLAAKATQTASANGVTTLSPQ